jgi:hypothetical protein
MRKSLLLLLLGCFASAFTLCWGQNVMEQSYWHNKERTLRYQPDGKDYVITNGTRRFNRALYGTNTAFRVEAGDLPEFALYMPGMGGNLKFGLITANGNKWLIDAQKITARYNPGAMIYQIEDPLLGKGKLNITVLAMGDAEGMIVRTEFIGITDKVSLIWAFGGASGKKFSRDGDMNVDPESNFYLKPENCVTNIFEVTNNYFTMFYGSGRVPTEQERNTTDKVSTTEIDKSIKRCLLGAVPSSSEMHLADATQLSTPEKLYDSKGSVNSALVGKVEGKEAEKLYFLIQNTATNPTLHYNDAASLFDKADVSRTQLANRVQVNTPDPFINNLGGAIAIAGDAIWESPTFMHGAIGWRIRLDGWRGPYTGDALGWHDRAEAHFNAYAKSQVTSPDQGPSIPDPDKNLARQQEKMGNALFTSGYICRNPDGKLSPHHYDMNLVYIDALLRHFNWTGDISYIKKMWPVIKRHLAWEKRNFDGDNDGLYDAYCCIWASDALQYSGSGVTHSSAYNYLANKDAAVLAKLIGEDPEPYRKESEKILKAMNTRLWMPSKGWYAEYQEAMGLKRLHPAAALWTVYHTLDSEVPDAFQAFQATRYIDTEIPHIPVRAKNLPDEGYYTLSTTNWMPYEWSINNVVPAESFHTSLAFWQAGRNDDAFKLWKSTILDAMYLGGSPGNFLQISTYDASRGEAYRDFADCVGMASRSLVEGLFGIVPDLLNGTLTIRPGLPVAWDHASLKTPDISFDFKRTGNTENYTIVPTLPKPVKLKFKATAKGESVQSVTVNGKAAVWTNVNDAIEYPQIEIDAAMVPTYDIVIEWSGSVPELAKNEKVYGSNETLSATFGKAQVLEMFDPQQSLRDINLRANSLTGSVAGEKGNRTAFAKVKQGQFTWWLPLCFEIKETVDVVSSLSQDKNSLKFSIRNNMVLPLNAKVVVNPGANAFTTMVLVKPNALSDEVVVPREKMITGSNLVRVEYEGKVFEKAVINWYIESPAATHYVTVNLTEHFNDKVTNIFKNEYLSPRSPYPTLAIPKQGIGDWCSPNATANIDDSGLRSMAGNQNEITTPQGIHFATSGARDDKNIMFTSQWDNYPHELSVPLSGNASHAYLLMAGSTYHMQSRITNGEVEVEYTDGTKARLELVNPETWCPIDQDYYVDGYAFSISQPRPMRLQLKKGVFMSNFDFVHANDYGGKEIDGGAANILDIPLDVSKQLKKLTLRTLSNEVVIGLMGVTLVQNN